MDRKQFINTVLPLGLSVSGLALAKTGSGENHQREVEPEVTVPPYLNNGDLIGITCPGGFITMEDVQHSVNKLREWGYRVRIGDTVGKKENSFGGTDDQRLADFQQMLDNREVKAIMCARGGYGTVRIIDKLNFKKFKVHPKWIIGFSDITVLHSHINRNYGIATLHSKMSNSFPANWANAEQVQVDSIESIRDCLSGRKLEYHQVPGNNNIHGTATGQLVGGNLKTIESLGGSTSDFITNNKILFVEDTGEYLYSYDRMFWNLKRTGKLNRLKGLIIGGLKARPDDPGEEFGKTVEEIVLEKTKEFGYPVCFNFPVGHQKHNIALKCGILHHLKVDKKEVVLKEL